MIRTPDLRRSLLFVAGADSAAHTHALQSRPDVLAQDLEDLTPPAVETSGERNVGGSFCTGAAR